jgi:hypothetical protein
MPIEYKKNRAVFRDEVSVEEAETLLEWLQNKPTVKVDLSALIHMHTASLQVLMAAKTEVANWPRDVDLRNWLEPVLKSTG